MTARSDLVAQWAFDTRSILLRFHLWLEDVEVDRYQPEPVSARSFMPRGIVRSLALTTAATALGTKLFGEFGGGAGKDKHAYNQVKKAADAISAYALSEGLWHLTRSLPENHAIMVSLGEGLMPKAGETPEMGANPLLGFGRVYARPEVARTVDALVHRLLNDPGHRFDDFYRELRRRGITVWGAAVDTLENTSRFAEGKETGPLTVLHIFDAPLTVTRPYEAYFGALTVPRAVTATAEQRSVMLDWATPRRTLLEMIEATYPGIRREHVHVWTLRGKSRAGRLGKLWAEWQELGVDLVDDGWIAPTGIPIFADSGTYAPTFLVKSWTDEAGATHVFLCDGYAATAEAMQAASLSRVLDVDVSMAVLSPTFKLAYDEEYRQMRLGAAADGAFREAILDAEQSNIPLGPRVIRADDLLPEKEWSVLAAAGYICDDPYTGTRGVVQLDDDRFRVSTRLATRDASSVVTFTLRFKQPIEEARLVFSPLLVRFMSGVDWRNRAVKISDSGRIRNELMTLISQALEHEEDRIRVHWDRIEEAVLARRDQETIRQALGWYKQHHPVWFKWLDLGVEG